MSRRHRETTEERDKRFEEEQAAEQKAYEEYDEHMNSGTHAQIEELDGASKDVKNFLHALVHQLKMCDYIREVDFSDFIKR